MHQICIKAREGSASAFQMLPSSFARRCRCSRLLSALLASFRHRGSGHPLGIHWIHWINSSRSRCYLVALSPCFPRNDNCDNQNFKPSILILFSFHCRLVSLAILAEDGDGSCGDGSCSRGRLRHLAPSPCNVQRSANLGGWRRGSADQPENCLQLRYGPESNVFLFMVYLAF